MKTTKTITTITDDLGGDGAASNLRFTYDGRLYEIDLNKRNLETFERRVAALYRPYVEAARDVTDGSTAQARKSELAAVREWAAANNWDISSRGRIPEDVMQAYRDAHPDQDAS